MRNYLTPKPTTSREYVEQLNAVSAYLLVILADVRRCNCEAHRAAGAAAVYAALLAAYSLSIYVNHIGDKP